jgi:hypothetical protein
MMTELKRVLMERDDLTSEEADEIIQEMRDMIYYDGINPEMVLEEMVRLEPDFVFDLI